jgi:hypothetical protein
MYSDPTVVAETAIVGVVRVIPRVGLDMAEFDLLKWRQWTNLNISR